MLSLLEEVDDGGNRMRGYGLIAATALIYVGIAVCGHLHILTNKANYVYSDIFAAGKSQLVSPHHDVSRRHGIPHL